MKVTTSQLIELLAFSFCMFTIALFIKQLGEDKRKYILLLIPPYLYISLMIIGLIEAPKISMERQAIPAISIDPFSLSFGIIFIALSTALPFKRLRLPGYIIGFAIIIFSILGLQANILIIAQLCLIFLLIVLVSKLWKFLAKLGDMVWRLGL